MKLVQTLIAVVALLMVGCGGPDLDDKETLDGIIAEAIDMKKLQGRGKKGEQLSYAPSEQTPYTGWTKLSYGNGQIMSLAQYEDGKANGLSTAWYPSGQKRSEGNWKDHEMTGLWSQWSKDGQKTREVTYEEGKKQGPATEWYENGQMKALGDFADDEKDGEWTRWHENGQKQCDYHWNEGVTADGVITFWHDNGRKAAEITFKNGKKHGLAPGWRENGQRMATIHYEEGREVSGESFDGDGRKEGDFTWQGESPKMVNKPEPKVVRKSVASTIKLQLRATGPIKRLILSDDYAKPKKKYFERHNLKAGWQETFLIHGSFRCYASSLENVRYAVDGGLPVAPQQSGAGRLTWPIQVDGRTITIPSLALDMLWVKPGSFEMGSPSSEKDRFDDETPHTVTLTQGFHLGKHEVTQSQWEKVMGSNPSEFKGGYRPVEKVSWTDVTSFCNKLTASERVAGRLPVGMTYQLPTEAQWEYACRAGTKTTFSFGDGLTSAQANISGGPRETTDVGKYPANAWGFHDMHGNVWEWCADWYGDYPTGAARNPVGPADGSRRV
jgi:antitoxin component YwqK of YwqJK toxin-antitoxin module